MEESTPTPAADAPQEPGVVSRMLNVLFSPGEVFQSVNRSVSAMDWLIPLVVTAIVSVIAVQILTPVVLNDTRQEVEAGLDKNPNMTQEQREKALAVMEKFAAISTAVAAPLMVFVMAVVLALLFLVGTNFIFGGEATFRKSLAVTGYCALVTIPSAIISTPLFLSMDTMVIRFGPGLLLPESMAGSFVYNLFANMDLFMIWQGALAAIGMGIVSGTGTRKAAIVVFVLFAIYLIGIAALRTSSTG